MGVYLGDKLKRMQSKTQKDASKSTSMTWFKALVKATLSKHLSLTEEGSKHLLAFRGMAWTLNLSLFLPGISKI